MIVHSRWLGLAIVGGSWAVAVPLYLRLPAIVTVPWRVEGARLVFGPTSPGSSALLCFLLPAVSLGLWLLANVVPAIDPARRFAEFLDTYWLLVNTLLTLAFVFHVLLLLGAAGVVTSPRRYYAVALGAALAVAGNYLTRVRRNWFIGFRTPWTLSDDIIWQRTNRLAAWLLVVAGVVVAMVGWATAVALPQLIAVTVAAVALVSISYSLLLWRQMPPHQ